MDQSVGAEKTGATLPAPCAEPVKLPTGRALDIKFRTDTEGLKLALRSELLSAHTTKTQRRTLRSVYFDTLAGDLHKQGTLLRVRKARNTHIMGLNGRDLWRKERFPPARSPFACRVSIPPFLCSAKRLPRS
jgi:CYTH domain